MGLFIGTFIISVFLMSYGYYIGKKYTVKTVRDKGLEEVDGKTYKYF